MHYPFCMNFSDIYRGNISGAREARQDYARRQTTYESIMAMAAMPHGGTYLPNGLLGPGSGGMYPLDMHQPQTMPYDKQLSLYERLGSSDLPKLSHTVNLPAPKSLTDRIFERV